ncbi:hypothetical protein [Saccharopolyspora sp. ASAGF58]|uniref:hypothetical protein n=1 Tax=Saccharopolyspora sp. ASAGF58 TaxID=2719023 RepID=UPI00143FB9AA|nr:hypothetical protein [Saccharopolyspora sp. ASAGF58]QIZ34740.1 hypothetical protein FDZ84_08415 [Saccharopolyspora sp. ASAGF58]
MTDYARLAKLMRSAIVMLGFAVDDIERGLWNVDDLEKAARGLDCLVVALRGNTATVPGRELVVIDATRADS